MPRSRFRAIALSFGAVLQHPSVTAATGERKESHSVSASGSSAWLQLPFLFATVITAVAGYLDAIGYSHLSNLYVSFMSGNSTTFGVAVARNNAHIFVPAAFVISAFVVGSLLGTLIIDGFKSFRIAAIFSVESCLVVLAVLLTNRVEAYTGLLPVCVAMGMQNAAHRSFGGADVGKSFVTGFLFGLGQSLAHVLRGRADLTQCWVYAVSWVSFVGGVIGGSTALTHLGFTHALLVGCGALIALTICVAIYERQGGLRGALSP